MKFLINKERLLKNFLEYLAIDSESGNEAAMAGRAAADLKALGCRVRIDEAGSVVAVFAGEAPALLMSAHIDTVTPGKGIRPIITEQSMEDVDIKKYVFEVAKDANKIEIKKAIEEIFDVTVIKVTTTHMRSNEKRQGQYPAGRTASWKKAVVKLSADSKNIELFEGMA